MTSVILLFCLIGTSHALIASSHAPIQLYDLSHVYAQSMPYKEGTSPFEPSDTDGERFAALEFCMSEKLGTHVNFPSYYSVATNQNTPLHLLVNLPCAVLDVGGTDKGQRNVAVTRDMVEGWEEQHGKIQQGTVLILRTGWTRFFSQKDSFYGLFSDEESLVMPGLNATTASWLVAERGVVGVATECPSIEVGGSGTEAGQALADGGVYTILQVTGVDQLPPTGARITVAPVKLEGGTGGPTRLFAAVGGGEEFKHNASEQVADATVSGGRSGIMSQGEEKNAGRRRRSDIYVVLLCLGLRWSTRGQ